VPDTATSRAGPDEIAWMVAKPDRTAFLGDYFRVGVIRPERGSRALMVLRTLEMLGPPTRLRAGTAY